MSLDKKVANGYPGDEDDVEAFLSPYFSSRQAVHDAIMKAFGTREGVQRLFAALTPDATRFLVEPSVCVYPNDTYRHFFGLIDNNTAAKILTLNWKLLLEFEGAIANPTTPTALDEFRSCQESVLLLTGAYKRTLDINQHFFEWQSGQIGHPKLTYLTDRNFVKYFAVTALHRKSMFELAHSMLSVHAAEIALMARAVGPPVARLQARRIG
jgi:hypothetical protein